MLRLPARSAAVQMCSAWHIRLSNAPQMLSSGSPGRWKLKSLTPCVPGQAPVAIVVQLVGVIVGYGTRQWSAQTPLATSFARWGSLPC